MMHSIYFRGISSMRIRQPKMRCVEKYTAQCHCRFTHHTPHTPNAYASSIDVAKTANQTPAK